MIKAIIFDFGNVICTFDNGKFIKRISAFTNKTPHELEKLIYINSDLPKKYETGLISSDEFIDKITSLCELKIEKEEFAKAFTEIFNPIRETFDLIKKLKPSYKLGLLSNTSELDFQRVIRPMEIFNLFDAVSLSYEVGAMKPAKEIFINMLKKLNLSASECVYIDDIKDYVDAAIARGLKGIRFTSSENLLESLKEIGASW
jgi:putative hydrolase of the HAD superfamily